jgi:hypothetical protein
MIYTKLGKRDDDAHLLDLASKYSELVAKISAEAEKHIISRMQTAQLDALRWRIEKDPNGAFLLKDLTEASHASPPSTLGTATPVPVSVPPGTTPSAPSRTPASMGPSTLGGK